MLSDRHYMLGLQLMRGLGAKSIRMLLKESVSPREAFEKALRGDLPVSVKYRPEDVFHTPVTEHSIEAYLGIMAQQNIEMITYDDPLYPEDLENTFNPPTCLFYKGNKEVFSQLDRSIAMVGARKCSVYGRSVALTLSEELSRQGVIIVSGGAMGIDAHCHEGALKGMSPTVAVMGCGLDKVYPRQNKRLFDKILDQGGLLLSEYPIGVEPKGHHFPMRNRIISGITKGTLVVEARASSGSLITADMAINEGRDVFAVPGNILKDVSEGTHWLIRQGAIVVTQAKDVLDEYNWSSSKSTSPKKNCVIMYTEEEGKVVEYLSTDEATSLEQLVQDTKLEVTKLQILLVRLELKRVIEQVEHHKYVLIP